MKKNRIIAYIVFFAMLVSMSIYTFSPCAFAITDRNGSITLHVADSRTKKALDGVTFRLYFFAAAYEKNNGVGYNYVIPYEECNMDMDNLQDAYLAVHLSNFALTHNLSYTEKASDSEGNIVFSNLVPGVYLILATEIAENYFMPTPFVINIPLYNHQEKNWEYDVNATPKMQILSADDFAETTYISVRKNWNTNEEIPQKVTVSLLRDLKVVDTVELNEQNNWYYKWEHLGKQHTWNVVESIVPEGYKVSYEFSSNTVIITNTKHPSSSDVTTQPSDTTVPDETQTPTSPDNKPTKPDENPTPTKPADTPESTTKPEELIDTGQLNWPVPVFSICGLLLFSLGWAILNFSKKDEETV